MVKQSFVFVVLCLFFYSCQEKTSIRETSKPYIVTTTTILADAVRNIVKDSAEVISIMGPGVDPHLYKASLGDLRKFIESDDIFYQGLHLEGKMAEVLEKLSRTKSVNGVGNALPALLIHQPIEGGNFPDPHIWFDVSIWKELVLITSDLLIVDYPQFEDYFTKNTAEYVARLDTLHKDIKNKISSIPKKKRVLITAHDAFSYFGRAYDIEVKGLQGISTQAEFGLKDVSDLVKLIIQRDIQAVFVETSVSDKSLRAVIEGVAGQNKKVEIGGLLYTDALGEPGTDEGTYVGMIKYNVNTIVKALK